jgi:hypothetical protein
MRRWATGVFALLTVVACASVEASGENLLKNPRFNEDLSSWQAQRDRWSAPGEAVWSPLDADGSSRSGSLELRTSALASRETFSVGNASRFRLRPITSSSAARSEFPRHNNRPVMHTFRSSIFPPVTAQGRQVLSLVSRVSRTPTSGQSEQNLSTFTELPPFG